MAASPVRPASAPRSLQEGGIMRIPLHKRQHAVAAEKRLAHERERVRRRAQEVPAAGSNDSTDHLVQGALAFSEAPLGVGYGTHYAEIYMGVPAQRASVIVDTGSHLTALPCSTCMDCGQHTDPLFDVSKSTTARYLACQAFGSCNSCQEDRCYISQSYTEGSMWQAVVVDELVWVGGFSGEDADAIVKHYGVRFPLGCQTKETGLFITQKENGIMGMGRHSKTVMAHMLSAGRLEHDIFSLCFDHSGGEMVLGGVDYSHHTTDVAYTPLLPSKSSFYPVRLKDIRVGGTTLGVPEDQLNTGKGVIVDSGTTDTFFVSSASRSFQQLFEAAAGRKYSETKMVVTAEELAELPTITVVLAGMPGSADGDIELEIPAEKYLTPSDNGKYYYGNFHFSERTGGVLGASSMVGLDVIFDSENERIGFAESLCGKGAASWKNATISSDSGSGSDITSPTGLSNAATSFDSTGSVATSERRSSPAMGTFIAEVLIITLLGIAVGVVLWTRRRKRSWAAIPDVESSRGVRSATTTPTSPSRREDVDDEAPRPSRVLSPPRQNAARKAPSPKFVIGDSDDEDLERLGGELTEL